VALANKLVRIAWVVLTRGEAYRPYEHATLGDSYDGALAEPINGLYKTELLHRQRPWRNMHDLEMATLGWVDWFNSRRLLGPIGFIPPAEDLHILRAIGRA